MTTQISRKQDISTDAAILRGHTLEDRDSDDSLAATVGLVGFTKLDLRLFKPWAPGEPVFETTFWVGLGPVDEEARIYYTVLKLYEFENLPSGNCGVRLLRQSFSSTGQILACWRVNAVKLPRRSGRQLAARKRN